MIDERVLLWIKNVVQYKSKNYGCLSQCLGQAFYFEERNKVLRSQHNENN